MKKGTVKWFNAEKVLVSSPYLVKTMYSYISPQFRLKATKHWKKARKLNLK